MFRFTRPLVVTTAALMTVGGLALSAPAFADDTTPEVASSESTAATNTSPTSPTTASMPSTESTEAPLASTDTPTTASDDAPSPSTEPTPASDSSPTSAPPAATDHVDSAADPIQGLAKGHDPVTLCHKPGTPAQATLTVDANAVKGHLGHGDALGECLPLPIPVEGWWIMPNGGTADHVTWPQAATSPNTVPCGVTAQVDTYPSQAVLDALAADGTLTEGEDYGMAQSWRFVYGGDCPVAVPPAAANPHANVIATCGVATPWVSNDLGDAKERLTASFVVYVDGVFSQALVAAGGEVNSGMAITFTEDSGDHTVTVRTGPAFGDVLLATASVHSDCITEEEPPVVVTPPTTEPTPPTTPPTTPTPTETPTASAPVLQVAKAQESVVADTVSDDTLAQTGSNLPIGLIAIGALLIITLGAIAYFTTRRKAAQK